MFVIAFLLGKLRRGRVVVKYIFLMFLFMFFCLMAMICIKVFTYLPFCIEKEIVRIKSLCFSYLKSKQFIIEIVLL